MRKFFIRINTFFDNEDPEAAAKAAAEKAAAEATAKAAAEATKRSYSQEELEKVLENEKKVHRESTNKLVAELEMLKKSQSLSVAEKDSLQSRIDEINKSLLTKEELAKQERERLEKEKKEQATQLASERDLWKSRFERSMIERSIKDAAQKAAAYSPDVFIALTRNDTFLEEVKAEDGKPTGEFAVKTKLRKVENGVTKELQMTPDELVKYMKEQPDTYGYLFKGEKQGGLGGGNASQPLGEVDWKSLTPEQYEKYRHKLLGK